MSDANEQRRAGNALGKLLALEVAAGVYCLATAGATGLMMAATDMSAQARGGHGGGHGGGHAYHGGGHGYHGGGHFVGRGRGHFWHGHWWGYGVGPCWRWTPAGYIWICG